MARPRKVLISLRVAEPTRAELSALAAAATATTGRRVTRSDVHRQMLADGIRRARQAPQYAARFAGEQPPAGSSTGAPHQEGAR